MPSTVYVGVLVGCAALSIGARAGGPGRVGLVAKPGLGLPVTQAVSLLPSARFAHRPRCYGWPLRPFDRLHSIRGGFGDPRFGIYQRNFHFGLDMPARGGTPVYAVAPGTTFLEPDHVDVLTGIRRNRASGFSYWHILPAIGEHVFVHTHALLGWVTPSWGHLHFSEIEHDQYVNPLRPGALCPSPPPFKPTIAWIKIAPTTAGAVSDAGYTGHVAVVADVYVRPPFRLPSPWQNAVVAPSLIRWRLDKAHRPLTLWQVAVDFRNYIPPNARYHDIYAPGTRPDTINHPGTYLFYLARNWNLDTLPAGSYRIEVEALGTRGAAAIATITLKNAAESARPRRLGDGKARPVLG